MTTSTPPMHATKATEHDTFQNTETEEGTNRLDSADQSQVTETQTNITTVTTSSSSIENENDENNAPPAATNSSSSADSAVVKTPITPPSTSPQEQEFQSMHQLIAAPGNGDGNPSRTTRSDNDDNKTTKKEDDSDEAAAGEVEFDNGDNDNTCNMNYHQDVHPVIQFQRNDSIGVEGKEFVLPDSLIFNAGVSLSRFSLSPAGPISSSVIFHGMPQMPMASLSHSPSVGIGNDINILPSNSILDVMGLFNPNHGMSPVAHALSATELKSSQISITMTVSTAV